MLSPGNTHKSDVGGVALDLLGPAAVRKAARTMAERVARARPEARHEGFIVEPMIQRPGAYELIFGVVRIGADPDRERAEYAILVRHDMTGLGLGILLMRRIIAYARRHGIKEIFGDVLRENLTMLKICRVLGFRQIAVPDANDLVRVTLPLHDGPRL